MSESAESGQKKGAPAWKLRESMKKQSGESLKRNSQHNINKLSRKSVGSVDPNLPPAFRAAFKRAAFEKQQARRKNNDEFVSLNSTHVGSSMLEVQSSDDDMSSFGGDSFGDDDSFGGEDDIEEGDEGAEEQ